MNWLDHRIATLKGVGPNLERKLQRLGIFTVGDLINHYPRRYDDFSKIVPISAMKMGLVTFRATVERVKTRPTARRNLKITEAILQDSTGTVKAVWFNQPYVASQLIVGKEFLVSGKLEFPNNNLQLTSPAVESVDKIETKDTARIVPIYPETEGLSSKQLRALIQPLIPLIKSLPETMPEAVTVQSHLLARGEALAELHFPTSTKQLEAARRRIAFEELFYLMLASLSIKQDIQFETAPEITFDPEVAKQFTGLLPFTLTNAQRAASWQILQDMEQERPMNRLLEGDVGSGKTLVAAMAAAMALHHGYQVALMVPTELLARQHASSLEPLMKQLGFEVALVLGGSVTKVKQAALDAINDNRAGLIIGTHALLSAPVTFANLGLVIIDEQHRFGVSQRQTLKAKAGHLPHLLSMTATPIPRSLALTVYGDLDISIIDTLPPGRQPITTKVVRRAERDEVYKEVDRQIAEGRQVFVVCPLIEESDKLGAKSVLAEAERLKKTIFSHRRIGIIHGKLSSAEKQATMEQFQAGQIDILVATSVIEVGIDIPNATVMLIEGADRFGLAALHQLRGRVGRGEHASFCYLLYATFSPGVAERLRAMEKSQDGFRLAQIDLELRGPGQIYGVRQHGILDLQMADISDTRLLAEVRGQAQGFLQAEENVVKYPLIYEQVAKLKAVTSLD
jgi:ATP-dependent DNA helicase RecG